MPAVAPPRCRKRRRRWSGSAQTRERQATGSDVEEAHDRPTGDELAHDPLGPRSSRARPASRLGQRQGVSCGLNTSSGGAAMAMPATVRTADSDPTDQWHHGLSRPRRERRPERVRGWDEVANHEAHRLTEWIPLRQPARHAAEQGGPSEERLDDRGHDVLRTEALCHRAVVRRQGSLPTAKVGVDGGGASSAETIARCRPSPVSGSRKPAASPTRSHPFPDLCATRCPSGAAPFDRISASAAAQSVGSSSVRGSRKGCGTPPALHRPRPASAARPPPPDDTDVHLAARDRCSRSRRSPG